MAITPCKCFWLQVSRVCFITGARKSFWGSKWLFTVAKIIEKNGWLWTRVHPAISNFQIVWGGCGVSYLSSRAEVRRDVPRSREGHAAFPLFQTRPSWWDSQIPSALSSPSSCPDHHCHNVSSGHCRRHDVAAVSGSCLASFSDTPSIPFFKQI